jgi:hypothetical protein
MATTAQRLAEYEELYRKAQQYNPNQYQSEFEKAYGEATNYNKDLIEQQAQALGELQAVAPTYRERYMNSLITDPTAQMALIAQARQAPITSYGTAANLLTARGQRYQDILNKALGGYQTAAEQANIAAENAWRLYQDALQQDQFNAQLRASRSGGGGGGSQINLLDLNGNGIIDAYETPGPAPVEDVGGGFIEDGGETSNWTSSAQKTNIFNAIPTLIGNYLGNTRIKKPGRELTFMEKLHNRRSNRGSGSVGGSW